MTEILDLGSESFKRAVFNSIIINYLSQITNILKCSLNRGGIIFPLQVLIVFLFSRRKLFYGLFPQHYFDDLY